MHGLGSRHKDFVDVHLNKHEADILDELQGKRSIDPHTGFPEYSGLAEKLRHPVARAHIQHAHDEMGGKSSYQESRKMLEMAGKGEHGDTIMARIPRELADFFDTLIGGPDFNHITHKRQYFSLSGMIDGVKNWFSSSPKNDMSALMSSPSMKDYSQMGTSYQGQDRNKIYNPPPPQSSAGNLVNKASDYLQKGTNAVMSAGGAYVGGKAGGMTGIPGGQMIGAGTGAYTGYNAAQKIGDYASENIKKPVLDTVNYAADKQYGKALETGANLLNPIKNVSNTGPDLNAEFYERNPNLAPSMLGLKQNPNLQSAIESGNYVDPKNLPKADWVGAAKNVAANRKPQEHANALMNDPINYGKVVANEFKTSQIPSFTDTAKNIGSGAWNAGKSLLSKLNPWG